MKKLRGVFGGIWRPLLACIAVGLILYMVFFSQLGSLLPGVHASEVTAYQSSLSLQQIIDNPVDAPHKLLQFGLIKAGDTGVFWLRAASAFYGAVAIGLFFFLLQRWHTARVAFLGSVLFATSSAFLHIARLGTPDVMQMLGILGLLAVSVRLERERPGSLSLLLCALVFGVLLYVPGFVWLILAGLVWKRRKVSSLAKQISWPLRIGISLLVAVLLAPLVMAGVKDISVLTAVAGLPQAFPAPFEFIKNLINVPLSFFIVSPLEPSRGLGRLPLLDIFATVMFGLGLYAHWFTRRSERTQFLIGSFIIGSLLVAIGGQVGVALLIPSAYIVTAAGIALLLQQWFTVFPRNPLARGVGISMVTAAVLIASFYHFNRYFVAWTNSPDTRQVFTESLNQVQ